MRRRTQNLLAGLIFGLLASGPLRGETVMAQSRSQSVSAGHFSASSDAGEMMMVSQAGGVRVERLRPGALGAPLEEGDVITRLNGLDVAMPEDILDYIRQRPALSALSLSVRRAEDEISLTVDAELFRQFMPPQPPEPPA
jgi:S1-C subfamily serine protease